MAESNSTILQAATLYGTSDYQQFIDSISQQTTEQVVQNMFAPMNRIYRNQFLDFLITRIGSVWVNKHSFENPLREFKRANLNYGNTVQLMALDYIKTHAYQDEEPIRTQDGDSLFKTYRPKGKAAYVSTNQFRQYPITINDQLLRTAFVSETGLNDLIAQVMRTPFNSDNYAEYRAMINSISAFDKANSGLVYRHKAFTAVPDDAEGARELLKVLKAYADKMRFPNLVRRYIPGDMPSTYRPDELALLVTPEVDASLDVDGLAQLFHVDRAEIPYRTIVVDDFGIEGCFAALVSTRTLLAMDVTYENNSWYNPRTLSTSYFLTHLQIAGVIDPFEPIILFGYGDGWNATSQTTITEAATGITLSVANGDEAQISAGGTLQLAVTLNGTLTVAPEGSEINGDITVAPDSATYEVTVATSDGTAVALNTRTYVDVRTNVLHLQKSGIVAGDVVTVKATGTYSNPTTAGDPATPFTSTLTVTVV